MLLKRETFERLCLAREMLRAEHETPESVSRIARALGASPFHFIRQFDALFGRTLTNSEGKTVCVRDVAEQHVLEDLGFIPSLSHWLERVPNEPWMMGLRTRTVTIVD